MSDPILDRIAAARRSAGLRVGTVTAIDTVTHAVTVSLAGATVGALRWVSTYSPTVGDVIVAARADGQWIVLGRLSKQLASPTVAFGEATLTPQWYAGDQRVTGGVGGEWFWQASQSAPQGRTIVDQDADYYLRAAIGMYPAPGSVLPAGASVLSAKLRLGLAINEPILRTPRIFTHTRPTPPTQGAPTPPTWVAGPWSPGSVLGGQSAQWDLPSAWLTSWLAGTVRGLGLASSTAADLAAFTSGVVTLAYSYTP